MKEIKELLEITEKLRDKYKKLNIKFSLDGKLVGDIGEVLAAEKYGLKLYSSNAPIHDGEEKSTGKKVQIKSSFREGSYFPHTEVPEYFLSLHITEDGELEELFNGPGQFIVDRYIKERKLTAVKNRNYTLSKGVLKTLNAEVPIEDKIKVVE